MHAWDVSKVLCGLRCQKDPGVSVNLLVLSRGTRGEWLQFSETRFCPLQNGDDNPYPPLVRLS